IVDGVINACDGCLPATRSIVHVHAQSSTSRRFRLPEGKVMFRPAVPGIKITQDAIGVSNAGEVTIRIIKTGIACETGNDNSRSRPDVADPKKPGIGGEAKRD